MMPLRRLATPRGALAAPRLFLMLPILLGLVALLGTGCGGDAAPPEERTPEFDPAQVRGARGQTVDVPVGSKHLPAEQVAARWAIDFRHDGVGNISIRPGTAVPTGTVANVARDEERPTRYIFSVRVPEGEVLPRAGELAVIRLSLPDEIVHRRSLRTDAGAVFAADATERRVEIGLTSLAVSLIFNPGMLFSFLAAVVAAIYVISQWAPLAGFFRLFPPLIWMYFIPMFLTTGGVTPDTSVVYSDLMMVIILPAVLVLLLIPSDLHGLAKLGGKAVLMMMFATTGIAVGAITSFAVFSTMMPESMPPDMWKAVATLSGSWIGGGINLASVVETIGTPPEYLGPLIIVDTVLAYTWLGILISLSTYQHRIDKRHGADSRVVEEISQRLQADHDAHARSPRAIDIALMIGIAFLVGQICLVLGGPVYRFFDSTLGWTFMSEVMSDYGWGIILMTIVALSLSLTPLRKLDYCGASAIGYVGLYLILTTFGARANLRAVLDIPIFFGIGALWLMIHIAFLYLGVRILRVPLLIGAASSMANIGGTASAPVVAAAYNQNMAPVGLLMAVIGSVIGTPVALLVIATACRAIAGQ